MKHKLSRIIAAILAVVILFESGLQDFAIGKIAADNSSTGTVQQSGEDSVNTGTDQEGGQEEEPVIVDEITEKREQNVKHFRLASGAYYAVQYDLPVHYKDDDGKWQDYDSTLNEVVSKSRSGRSESRLQVSRSDKDISLRLLREGTAI